MIAESAHVGQRKRWWAPVERGRAAGGRVDSPLVSIFGSRARETQREAAAIAADLAWLLAELPAARRADTSLLQMRLEAAREMSRRAAARGEPAAIHTAHRQAVLWAAVASEAALPAPWANDLLAAALWLGRRGAVELPSAAERRLAMALAAVACAFSGRPLHWVAASDEDAVAAAAAAAPIVAACGLRAAVVHHDAAPAVAAAGYRADIVFATLRRLAADLLRDRRVQAAGGAAGGSSSGVGPLPLLTRGAHTALVDDIDRLLIDDAIGPLVLSVADDSSGLADALVAARDLADLIRPRSANSNSAGERDADADGDSLTAEELRRLSEFKQHLPAMWRGAGRSETLVLQALHVRDSMQAGRDYFFSANGQLLFDEALADRLPDRAYMAGITQALQARLRLPLSPVARTVERSSVITFFAGYRRLAGCAAALDGLYAELWQHYRLHLRRAPHLLPSAHTAPPRPLPGPRPRCLGDAAAWAAAIDEIANVDTGAARLFIVRHQRELARLQPLLRPGQVAAALDTASASSALAGLVTPPASGSAASRIEIVLTEPLDSARAERALLRRLHDAQIQRVDSPDAQGAAQTPTPPNPTHAPPPPQVTRLAHPGARVLVESLPLMSSVGAALGRFWPAAARRLTPPLLPGLIRFAQMLASRRARRQRVAVMLREQQLQQQLSFTGAPARRNLAPASKDASTKKRG